MSKENMEVNKSPYMEDPKTLNPTINNKEDLQKGGGGDGKK